MPSPAHYHALARKAQRSGHSGELHEALRSLVATGTPGDLAALLDDSAQRVWPDPRESTYRSLYDGLPAARAEMASVFLAHLKTRPWTEPVVLRGAEMLAVSQPRAVVKTWLQQGLSDHPFAPVTGLLAHTLTLQGWHGDQTELSAQLQSALRRTLSPLAALPLTLGPAEQDLPLRQYHYPLGQWGHESSPGPGGSLTTPGAPARSRRAVPVPTRLPEVPDGTGLLAVVEGWVSGSGGQVETAAFSFASAPGPLDASVLAMLPLASVSSFGALTCEPVSAAEVVRQGFLAAAGGGAYGGARYGALGRLAAWQTLGALVGLPFTGNGPEVLERAARSSLVVYRDDRSRFSQDGWALAVACLRADGRTLVLLAASDTD